MKTFIRLLLFVAGSFCFSLAMAQQHQCRPEDAASCAHQAQRARMGSTMHFQSQYFMRSYRNNQDNNELQANTSICRQGRPCRIGKRMSLQERHQLRRQINQAGKSLYNE